MEDIENKVVNLANNPRWLQVNLQVKLANLLVNSFVGEHFCGHYVAERTRPRSLSAAAACPSPCRAAASQLTERASPPPYWRAYSIGRFLPISYRFSPTFRTFLRVYCPGASVHLAGLPSVLFFLVSFTSEFTNNLGLVCMQVDHFISMFWHVVIQTCTCFFFEVPSFEELQDPDSSPRRGEVGRRTLRDHGGLLPSFFYRARFHLFTRTIETSPDKKLGVGSLRDPWEYDGRLPPDAGYYLNLVIPRFEESPKKKHMHVVITPWKILKIKWST